MTWKYHIRLFLVATPPLHPNKNPNFHSPQLKTQSTKGRVMASKVFLQLQGKATQASKVVAEYGSSYYKQVLEKNRHYVQEPPTAEKCSLLSKHLFYTRLASIPRRYEAFQMELDSVKQMWKNRQALRVEDAGITALFGLECFAWFCAGEMIGRGFTFTGYRV